MKSNLPKLLLLLFITFQIQAQELLPFVENYNKSSYEGDNQTWSVAQGNDNAMYFANNHYLVRYNGVVWEKYTLPNKTIIRSIMVDGDKVYSGTYKEFGYWYRQDGKMKYVSVSKKRKVFDENENEEVWKIFKHNGLIYFQSFNQIFTYDGKSIKKTKLPFLISYCFVVDNQLLVASVEHGVFVLNGNKLNPVKGWDALKNNVIHAIEKYQNKIYIFTHKKGIFVADKSTLTAWNNPLNDVLKNANINVARFLKNNKLIIGTAGEGIYMFDFNDNSFKNINRKNVLMNNSILSIGLDKEDDLWLGLDNGIAHIEVTSPVSIFYDNSGVLGSVYSVVNIDKEYLMASNHGVFKYVDKKLSLIPNSQGQAWNISKVDNRYFIGHNEGTFLYKNGQFSKLNTINGGWNFTKSSIGSCYFQATYSGVVVYKDINNLEQKVVLKGLMKPIKYVAQNKKK